MSAGELFETNSIRRVCELVIDTSALLLISRGVNPVSGAKEVLEDYCSNIRISLLTRVIWELEKLATGRGRRAVSARLALIELSKLDIAISVIDFSDCYETDECILKYSRSIKNSEVIVLTVDKKLAKALRENGIKYVTWWKSRRRFVLEFP